MTEQLWHLDEDVTEDTLIEQYRALQNPRQSHNMFWGFIAHPIPDYEFYRRSYDKLQLVMWRNTAVVYDIILKNRLEKDTLKFFEIGMMGTTEKSMNNSAWVEMISKLADNSQQLHHSYRALFEWYRSTCGY